MLAFRPMRSDEFPVWLDYFLPDYATEIAANYKLSAAAPLEQAKREIAIDLPDGPQTEGQELLCILDREANDERLIGYLWYRPIHDTRSVFINDFHILNAEQGKGLGKQALALFEGKMAEAGFVHIRLRVAADNGRALHVYKDGGFGVTGINMSKRIGDD